MTKISAKKVPISEMTFVRSFKAEKDGHKISISVQPYLTGMYVAISDSQIGELIQQSRKHKELPKFFSGLEKRLKGYKIEKVEHKFVDYLKAEDLKEYSQL